jgi:hypothetical protein
LLLLLQAFDVLPHISQPIGGVSVAFLHFVGSL